VEIALALREQVNLGAEQRYRLIGVGFSNFREPEDAARQPGLFSLED
jgi:DNA polymerase-4